MQEQSLGQSRRITWLPMLYPAPKLQITPMSPATMPSRQRWNAITDPADDVLA